MASNLAASLHLVAMPGAPSSFLLLGVRPGAPSSVFAPNSDGLQPNSDEHSSKVLCQHFAGGFAAH